MKMASGTTAFDRGVRPLLQLVLLDKAHDVLSFRPDPALRDRIEELATKSTEGELSDEERAEYEGYVRANNFVAVLRRQARRIVGDRTAHSSSAGRPWAVLQSV